MAESIFWTSFLFIFYTYMGYPLLLFVLSYYRNTNVLKSSNLSTVSVVIAACNEERNIGQRLDDLLRQDYPADQMEIIVVSDGSTDGTEEIVASFENRNIRLFCQEVRRGKAAALNQGVSHAMGDIVVFTDARQSFEPGAIKELVANFSDPSVGCASGELIFLHDRESEIQAEMGAYWNYEKWIRKAESRTGSMVGATGAVYAIRRDLYRPLPEGTILDDVLTPLCVVMQGYRAIFDRTALAYDIVSKDFSKEWKRKVRTLAGNWQLMSLYPSLLLPYYNRCWWRFLSHKIFRLIIPFALLTMFVSGAMGEESFYRFLTILQLFFYLVAISGMMAPAVRKIRLVNLSCFFLVMNLAAFAGFWRWVTGGCHTAWLPAYAEQGIEQ